MGRSSSAHRTESAIRWGRMTPHGECAPYDCIRLHTILWILYAIRQNTGLPYHERVGGEGLAEICSAMTNRAPSSEGRQRPRTTLSGSRSTYRDTRAAAGTQDYINWVGVWSPIAGGPTGPAARSAGHRRAPVTVVLILAPKMVAYGRRAYLPPYPACHVAGTL